jgi:hypothetical protein
MVVAFYALLFSSLDFVLVADFSPCRAALHDAMHAGGGYGGGLFVLLCPIRFLHQNDTK